jgi:hypothetical protein
VKHESVILFDWLSFSAKHHDAHSIVELLGLRGAEFETINGRHGWRHAMYYNGISIYYGGRDDCVFCDMSGAGCRAYEEYGKNEWTALFAELRSDDEYNITRLDVAFDERVGLFNLKRMKRKAERKEYVSKLQWGKTERSLHDDAISIYFGSPRSATRFRFYDKAKERGREDEGHWVRLEIQMRDENAGSFLDKLPLYSIGELFVAVVNNYVRFVEPNATDSNKRRWKTSAFWDNFIGSAGKLSLYEAPGEEYNMMNLNNFVINQAGAAAAVFIDIHGVDEYISRCRRQFNRSRNERYKRIRKEHSQGHLPELPPVAPIDSDKKITCTVCGQFLDSDYFVIYNSGTGSGVCRECWEESIVEK